MYISKKEKEGNSFKKEMGEQENPLLKKFETHKSHMPRERENPYGILVIRLTKLIHLAVSQDGCSRCHPPPQWWV